MARARLEAPSGTTGGATASSSSKQAPLGFEHALAVDLAALFGVRGQVGKDGGAKHIALLGNTLAVATDHAVFVLRLSFDVKGKTFFLAPACQRCQRSGCEVGPRQYSEVATCSSKVKGCCISA